MALLTPLSYSNLIDLAGNSPVIRHEHKYAKSEKVTSLGIDPKKIADLNRDHTLQSDCA